MKQQGRGDRAISIVGGVAAVAVLVLLNLLAARHFHRWDMSEAQLYTLSQATVSTLKSLEKKVNVHVLLASSDPLRGSISHLLDIYRAHSLHLEVQFVDPDRYPAEFVAVQQKYGIEAGRTQDGRVVADAAIVVASGQRHWFVTAQDMVDFGDIDEGITTSRLEQSLTGAIRAVIRGQRKNICFSYGHGEFSIDDVGQGLGEFRQRLVKNNFDTTVVNAVQQSPEKAYQACDALVVASPSQVFSEQEARAIDERMQQGMGGLFMLNPILDTDKGVQANTGLELVAARFGIGFAKDFVFELDDTARLPRGSGEVFFPSVQPHRTTQGLDSLSIAVANMRVVLVRTRSLDVVTAGVRPVTILKTSDKAFGMTDFFAWAKNPSEPVKGALDRAGPLAVAMASELEKPSGSNLDHGGRLVVVGSANMVLGQNWRDPALRGNAVLAGNIVSWIAATSPIVDVPAKQTIAATVRITKASVGEITRYVMLFMPASAALLGVAMYIRRRSIRRSDNRTNRKSDIQRREGLQ